VSTWYEFHPAPGKDSWFKERMVHGFSCYSQNKDAEPYAPRAKLCDSIISPILRRLECQEPSNS
jgi:hypothetical protein